MFMRAAALGVAMFAGSAASALTVSESFNFLGAGSQNASVLSYTSGTVSVDIRANNYDTPVSVGDPLGLNGAYNVSRLANFGLFITYSGDNDHRIDGLINEILTFDFSRAVTITSISFGSIRSGSVFDLFLGDAGLAQFDGSALVQATVNPANGGLGDYFGIGASANSETRVCERWYRGHCKKSKTIKDWSAFKITGLTVSYDEPPPRVPLPAGGALLAGAVAGLMALRRRRA